jgi:hypothetical protein
MLSVNAQLYRTPVRQWVPHFFYNYSYKKKLKSIQECHPRTETRQALISARNSSDLWYRWHCDKLINYWYSYWCHNVVRIQFQPVPCCSKDFRIPDHKGFVDSQTVLWGQPCYKPDMLNINASCSENVSPTLAKLLSFAHLMSQIT